MVGLALDTSAPPFPPHPALGCLGLLPGFWLLRARGWVIVLLGLLCPISVSGFQERLPALVPSDQAPCTAGSFVVSLNPPSSTPSIKLSSNYPICMCHLFPAGTLTDTVFLICLCTISAYTLTPTHIYSLTHSGTRTHACTHSITQRHIPTLTLTHRHSRSLPNSLAILTHHSASAQLWGVECSGKLRAPSVLQELTPAGTLTLGCLSPSYH